MIRTLLLYIFLPLLIISGFLPLQGIAQELSYASLFPVLPSGPLEAEEIREKGLRYWEERETSGEGEMITRIWEFNGAGEVIRQREWSGEEQGNPSTHLVYRYGGNRLVSSKDMVTMEVDSFIYRDSVLTRTLRGKGGEWIAAFEITRDTLDSISGIVKVVQGKGQELFTFSYRENGSVLEVKEWHREAGAINDSTVFILERDENGNLLSMHMDMPGRFGSRVSTTRAFAYKNGHRVWEVLKRDQKKVFKTTYKYKDDLLVSESTKGKDKDLSFRVEYDYDAQDRLIAEHTRSARSGTEERIYNYSVDGTMMEWFLREDGVQVAHGQERYDDQGMTIGSYEMGPEGKVTTRYAYQYYSSRPE